VYNRASVPQHNRGGGQSYQVQRAEQPTYKEVIVVTTANFQQLQPTKSINNRNRSRKKKSDQQSGFKPRQADCESLCSAAGQCQS